jgi:hypothetical protein
MTSKKKGGPVTIKGKAVISRNAMKHGLTSSRPSTPNEKQIFDSYVQELTKFYKPDSPLEKLQIERIAICKVKLDRLYQVERIQLELATEKFSRNPDQILDQIAGTTGIVRGMVKELIEYGEITLPCKLTSEQLELICEETSCLRKDIIQESDIENYWPNLSEFLTSYHSIGLSKTDARMKKLEVIAERIENLFRSENDYRERFQEWVEILLKAKAQLEPEPKPPTEHALELDRHIERRNRAREAERHAKYPPKPKPEITKSSEPVIDQVKLELQLRLFSELLKYRKQSYEVYRQYQSLKELMIGGVALPQQESDLMMRYQTALDRRLSTAIGEMLHLQAKKAS